MTPAAKSTDATGSRPGDKTIIRWFSISYLPMPDGQETIEKLGSPDQAIDRLKYIRRRRYEAIAAIDRQIETLEGFL